jgi:hypothetical protein
MMSYMIDPNAVSLPLLLLVVGIEIGTLFSEEALALSSGRGDKAGEEELEEKGDSAVSLDKFNKLEMLDDPSGGREESGGDAGRMFTCTESKPNILN